MLAQTVRDNVKSVNNLRTKATKFSSLFQSVPIKEEASLEEVLAKAHLTPYVKTEEIEVVDDEKDLATATNTDEDFEYIVENPNEVVVQFPIKSDINLGEKLPFFKSITMKLNKIYG